MKCTVDTTVASLIPRVKALKLLRVEMRVAKYFYQQVGLGSVNVLAVSVNMVGNLNR
jgi:hypothetical protein